MINLRIRLRVARVCKTLNVGSSPTVASQSLKKPWKPGLFDFPKRPSLLSASRTGRGDGRNGDKVPCQTRLRFYCSQWNLSCDVASRPRYRNLQEPGSRQ